MHHVLLLAAKRKCSIIIFDKRKIVKRSNDIRIDVYITIVTISSHIIIDIIIDNNKRYDEMSTSHDNNFDFFLFFLMCILTRRPFIFHQINWNNEFILHSIFHQTTTFLDVAHFVLWQIDRMIKNVPTPTGELNDVLQQ